MERAISNAIRKTAVRTKRGITYMVIARTIGTKRGTADIIVRSPRLAMQITLSLCYASDADEQHYEKSWIFHGVSPS